MEKKKQMLSERNINVEGFDEKTAPCNNMYENEKYCGTLDKIIK